MTNRPLAPKGGNDSVYTPSETVSHIMRYFYNGGTLLEPCAGNGAFLNCPHVIYDDYCEINPNCSYYNGKDFLTHPIGHFDWIITNPPWSKFRPFLNKSMEVADNVVFLSLFNAWFMKARVRDIINAGFGFKSALMLPTPSKPWPQTGFQLAAVHIQKSYNENFQLDYKLL